MGEFAQEIRGLHPMLARLTDWGYFLPVVNAGADISSPPRIPAPPELVARAEALVKEYETACFWFWHPEAKVRYMDDVDLVIHHLREYGNHKAWKAAQELRKCL